MGVHLTQRDTRSTEKLKLQRNCYFPKSHAGKLYSGKRQSKSPREGNGAMLFNEQL